MSTPPVFHSTVSDRSFLLLSFATFSSSASQRICDAMLPELAREFGVGLAEAARVVSVFAVVYGALQPSVAQAMMRNLPRRSPSGP